MSHACAVFGEEDTDMPVRVVVSCPGYHTHMEASSAALRRHTNLHCSGDRVLGHKVELANRAEVEEAIIVLRWCHGEETGQAWPESVAKKLGVARKREEGRKAEAP